MRQQVLVDPFVDSVQHDGLLCVEADATERRSEELRACGGDDCSRTGSNAGST